MTLPRVLIIGQPFNNDTGGGITLSNLFNGWDRDKLAVACSGYSLLDNIDAEVCNTYYQLGSREHKWIFPFSLIKRKYSSGLVKFSDKRIQNLTQPRSKIRLSLIEHYFYPFLRFVGLFHAMSKIEMSKEFYEWVDEYNPDIIYAQTSSRAENLFCLSVQSYLKKPFVFHMMDDWPSIISDTGLFKNWWHKKIDREFRNLLDKTSLLLSICDYMSQEYKVRYGKDSIAFHNPIDLEFWKSHQRTDYLLGDPPVILYAGRIGLGIEASLESIAQAVQLINEELNISVKFVLQTSKKPSWIANYSSVEHKSFVSYNDLPIVFSEADLLILPYDFSSKSIKYIRFSMPTKAPEYMISGTPIIIFAPEDTAIVKYAKDHNWAEVVSENNPGMIYEAIKQLIENKELRRQMGQNAIKTAEKYHNSADVTNHFKQVICSLIN